MFARSDLSKIDNLDRFLGDAATLTGAYEERVQLAFNYNLSGVGDIAVRGDGSAYAAILQAYCSASEHGGRTTFRMRDLSAQEALDIKDRLRDIRDSLSQIRGFSD